MEGLIVEKAGLLDTIQDQGRWGYQAFGVVVAGAMDSYAYQLGNILLGNDRNSASLEITLLGPQLIFSTPTQIVITGGDLSPTLNDRPAPMWQVISLKKNDRLTFGSARSGCRSYLAIHGGFQLNKVMGSYSTYLKANLGGWKGRSIEQGDIIPYISSTENPKGTKSFFRQGLAHDLRPVYEDEIVVRVLLGPQDNRFTERGLDTFLNKPFTVTAQMDRMGIRLRGDAIEHLNGADILSDAMPLGGIQVPPDGQPIILMSDRQTTGGYTKIGTVISTDIHKLAQVRPNHTIQFKVVSLSEAQDLYREEQLFLSNIAMFIKYKIKMSSTERINES
jgi:antagonist of KipI